MTASSTGAHYLPSAPPPAADIGGAHAGSPTGAYGIPQAYPGSKMAAFGSNWRTSPLTQVKWGLWYINSRYGSACAAYNFWSANGWY